MIFDFITTLIIWEKLMQEDRFIVIKLLSEDNVVSDKITFAAKNEGRRVSLSCLEGPLGEKKYTGVDYFWTFVDMRKDLERQFLRPACKGALINVFPGGLQGESSLGLRAYVFNSEGKVADSVDIFTDVCCDLFEKIVFFDKQKAFRRSLR